MCDSFQAAVASSARDTLGGADRWEVGIQGLAGLGFRVWDLGVSGFGGLGL